MKKTATVAVALSALLGTSYSADCNYAMPEADGLPLQVPQCVTMGERSMKYACDGGKLMSSVHENADCSGDVTAEDITDDYAFVKCDAEEACPGIAVALQSFEEEKTEETEEEEKEEETQEGGEEEQKEEEKEEEAVEEDTGDEQAAAANKNAEVANDECSGTETAFTSNMADVCYQSGEVYKKVSCKEGEEAVTITTYSDDECKTETESGEYPTTCQDGAITKCPVAADDDAEDTDGKDETDDTDDNAEESFETDCNFFVDADGMPRSLEKCNVMSEDSSVKYSCDADKTKVKKKEYSSKDCTGEVSESEVSDASYIDCKHETNCPSYAAIVSTFENDQCNGEATDAVSYIADVCFQDGDEYKRRICEGGKEYDATYSDADCEKDENKKEDWSECKDKQKYSCEDVEEETEADKEGAAYQVSSVVSLLLAGFICMINMD